MISQQDLLLLMFSKSCVKVLSLDASKSAKSHPPQKLKIATDPMEIVMMIVVANLFGPTKLIV